MLAEVFTFYHFWHLWATGEVVSVPLSRTVISIWPLPFGLLLQQAAEVNQSSHIPFSSATPTLASREMLRQRKETGNISPQNFHSSVAHELTSRRDMSSHLILRDPLEEPEVNDVICLDFSCLLNVFWSCNVWLYYILHLVTHLTDFSANLSRREGKVEHNEGLRWENNLDKWPSSPYDLI